jgi:hypothetical protein
LFLLWREDQSKGNISFPFSKINDAYRVDHLSHNSQIGCCLNIIISPLTTYQCHQHNVMCLSIKQLSCYHDNSCLWGIDVKATHFTLYCIVSWGYFHHPSIDKPYRISATFFCFNNLKIVCLVSPRGRSIAERTEKFRAL